MVSSIGFFTLPQVAEALLYSKTTVKRLVQAGLLRPRYQVLSGRCYRLVFEPAELMRFMSEYFPTPEDLALPTGKSKIHKERVERLRRLMNQHLVGIGRINDMRAAKKSGLEGKDIKAQEKEPVIVDQRPSGGPRSPRGSNVQAEGAGGDERNVWSSRDDEDEET